MSKTEREQLQSQQKLLIPFFTAGYPKLDSTKEIVQLLEAARSDYIEVGLPHSDALADGPVIQKSSQKAIENGINLEILLEQVNSLKKTRAKLILFSYFNPVLAYGLERVLDDWKAVGGSGLLIPDLPLEESSLFLEMARAKKLELVFLATLTSTPERLKKTVELNQAFTYLVSVTGVTGIRSGEFFSSKLQKIIQTIKAQRPEIPVALGFGVSQVDQVKDALELGADGVVIGSALVRLFGEEKYAQASELLSSLREILDKKEISL